MQNLVKQFTLDSVEAFSEPSQVSKQGGYLLGGNCFRKNSLLDGDKVLNRFFLVNHKKQSNHVRQGKTTWHL